MWKKLSFSVVLLAVISVFLVSGCVQQTTTTPDLEPGTHSIEIENFAFQPAELKIEKGDTVIWTNKDSAQHTVTSDSGAELDSGLLSQGETYSHTFNEVGTFDYHCTPHPFMKAKIIVE
jgi:amicyanin